MVLERFFVALSEQDLTTSLIYLPQHLFLWLFLWSEARYYRRHPVCERRNCSCLELGASDLVLLAVKCILTLVLIVFVLLDVGRPTTLSWVRIFETLSYCITLMLLFLGEKYNVRDQTFLLSFWLLELLVNCIRIVDQLTVRSVAYGAALLAMILLTGTRKDESAADRVQPNLIRSMCFSWFSEVSRNVHRSQLEELGTLESSMMGARLIREFTKDTAVKGQYEMVAGRESELVQEVTMCSLLWPFRWDLVTSGINRFFMMLLFFICPFLLRQILRNDRQATTTESHSYVISIFFVSLIIAVLNGQYLYDTQKIGLKIKSILMILIYDKLLKLKNPNGTDITLLTLDSTRFIDLLPHLHLIWSGPLIIVISITGLVVILGNSAWIGVVVMIATICFTKLIANQLQLLQRQHMNLKDPRISSTNEAIGMIKQIKLLCWEDFIERRVLKHRKKELQTLKRIIYWDAPKYLLGVISPFLVSLSTFGLMIMIGDSRLLTLESVFVSIALFNILKYPLSMLPVLPTSWTATQASIGRINEFLKMEEVPSLPRMYHQDKPTVRSRQISNTFEDVLAACRKTLDPSVVSIRNLNIHREGKVILEQVDLRVQEGSFVVLTGPVGCGKSSLLLTILGELEPTGGSVNVTGRIAYVSQEPWVLNRTIKNNILFEEQYDQLLYEEVVQACALRADMDLFPAKDETIVGEKGATVSGGQKQRIALARAVYQNADLYLLDDPLSSVDGEVSHHIYSNVFGINGLLKQKTVIMVTQDHAHYKNADLIIMMENGRIAERHTYQSYKNTYHDIQSTASDHPKTNELLCPQKPEDHQLDNSHISKDTTQKVSPKIYFKYLTMLGIVPAVSIVICNVAIPVCDICSTFWLAKWSLIDHQTATSEDHRYLLGYAVFILGLIILSVINNAAITIRGISVARQTHDVLLHTTVHQQMSFFESRSSGQIMNRFSNDLDVVDSKISLHLRDFLTNLTNVIAILLLFCVDTSFYIVIVLIMIMVTYCLLLVYHLDTSRHLKRMEARSKAPIIQHFNESREGRSTIRAFRREDQFLGEFINVLDRHQHYSYLYLASSRWLGIRLEIIGAIVIYFVAMLAVHNQDTIGVSNVGVCISYALRLIPLLNALIRTTALLEENATSLERIDNYLKEPNGNPVQRDGNSCPPDWPNHGTIEFNHFGMEYGDHNLALKNITLRINSQEKIGITGRTGAGKTSLISALFRLYPSKTQGTITIDGVNIDHVPLRKLRRSLTVIPQCPLLFSGTIRENLDPCMEQSDDATLWRALDCCNLKELVASLPHQLNTHIDERGSNLSVGQKQLLCLVRGILRSSKIVILDEATSTMDAETEKIIQQAMFRAFRDCTVLMIAHRKNTLQQVDRVLCMRQGMVVKFDRPNSINDRDLMDL